MAKKKSTPVVVVLLALIAAVAGRYGIGEPQTEIRQPQPTQSRTESSITPGENTTKPYLAGAYQIAGVTIVDIRTGQSKKIGTVDLRPVIDRIAKGEKNPHRNDGAVFRNASRKLPTKPQGYYREYVVPTRGVSGPGPQRLVIGKNGETYYTHDHYESFILVEKGK